MGTWTVIIAGLLVIALAVVPLAELAARNNPDRPRNLAFRTSTSLAGAVIIFAAFGALVAGFSVCVARAVDASAVPIGVGWVCWTIGVAALAVGMRLRAGDPELAFLLRSGVALGLAVAASLALPARYMLVGIVGASLLARGLIAVWRRRSERGTAP